ncbi:MAG: cytochrome-c peroxidase [Gammaproteobacteria bacterium]
MLSEVAASAVLGVILAAASGAKPGLVDGTFTPDEVAAILELSPLEDVPEDETNAVANDPRAARLGQFLFFDTRLSANGRVSCASCHRPDHGFSVPARLGQGLGQTPRHPPSLLNVAYQRWFDWDGKADSLWAQAVRPLEAPGEHGLTRTELARLIVAEPPLRQAYEEIFGAIPELSDAERFPDRARDYAETPRHQYHEYWMAVPVHPHHQAWLEMAPADRSTVNRIFTNVTKSVAAYVARLSSRNAPFDRYVAALREEDATSYAAISEKAKRGLKSFIGKARCLLCHGGPNFTDNAFHNTGLGPRPWLDSGDAGRFDGVAYVKKSPFSAIGHYSDERDGMHAQELRFLRRTTDDRGQFKTPSLRNVALTPPYMHGGHFDTLEEVVRFYSTLDERPAVGHREATLHALGLSELEIEDLIEFMNTLTGERLEPPLTRRPASPSVDDNFRTFAPAAKHD